MQEIERKWLLDEWPQLPLIAESIIHAYYLYVDTDIEVRLQQKSVATQHTDKCEPIGNKLSIKIGNGMTRGEYETEITDKKFQKFVADIQYQPIKKLYRVYDLDGRRLQVSKVDDDWMYAELEFASEEEALAFQLPFTDWVEVTGYEWQMKNYWFRTRIYNKEK
jgi:hypothetical protein